jgi:hypothetical protein
MGIFIDDQTNCDQRSGADRRKNTPPIFSKYWVTGRRAALRREEDRQRPYRLDRHGVKTFLLILLIIMLSISDALLTLYLIDHGASEINPLMAYFLSHGPLVFFAAKYFLTCTAIIIVLFNKNMYLFNTKIRVKILFFLFLIPFALVVNWELYLILFAI